MAKRKGIREKLSQLTASGKSLSGKSLEEQIQALIEQQKYSKALRTLQQSLKRDPDQNLTVTEADIWLLQGKYEFEQARYPQAERSLQKALALGLTGDVHYWLAKSLLAQQQSAAALELFQTAFDDKTLPKDLGGGYLKLLFLNDKADEVEKLVKTQAKRFYAPHLHWARGALALKAGNPQVALPHFKKMGRQASPGDHLMAWQAYAHQKAGNWSQAEKAVSMTQPAFMGSLFRSSRPELPVMQRLKLFQAAHTKGDLANFFDLRDPDLPDRETVLVLAILNLIHADNVHDAAHLAMKLTDEMMANYPAIQPLYRPLMLLAGNQAHQQQEFSCSASFWGKVVDEPTFDPNLALHLYQALELTDAYREARQLINRLLTWVQQAAKQNPQDWPKARLNPTLAKLHCWLADAQMVTGRDRDAARSLRKAEQLAPDHPDVIGRKGLEAFVKGQEKAAIPLLTQALEAGCRFPEVYSVLLDALEGDAEAVKTIRRKFGKHFGDISVDTEVEIPLWTEALTFQNYKVMEQFVSGKQKLSPALKACQIFLASADGEPSSSQKITLNQEKAVPQWDKLLQAHGPTDQVEILKAIYLIIQQHARRNQKGMAALQSRYAQQIADLTTEVREAELAHLMLLPLKKLSADRLKMAVTAALNRATQPGDLLAKAQLQLCRFDANKGLRPFIEAQLKQEPQNPLLLLAKATLYPRNSREYATFYDQGFEIARRLQDAAALHAFREEEWFKAQDMTRRAVGSQLDRLNDPSQLDMVDMLKRLAREALGVDVPDEVIAQMLPELEAQMAGGFFEEDDEDFDDEFDPFFLPPPRGKKSSKKRKPWYQL
ncbi:MAG: tetratricopeptide repeat protein [Cyanobacteria bacterium P01_A01_bin.114]